jgi:two-component system LytT family response regulator
MPIAVLIDDEATARADLRAKLGEHPDITLVGEAATVRNARELLRSTEYTLVFLDVQLIGGDAFDLVSDVRPDARIIFVTGYDDYALRAFEVNALDYLLKPIAPARLAEALRRLPTATAENAVPSAGATALRLDDRVYLRAGLTARFATVSEISVITASDNYSEVILSDGDRLFVRRSLKEWENLLPTSHFMRVHRTGIVNLARVVKYERDRDEHTQLFLEGAAKPVAASRDRWTELRARLEQSANG